MTTKKINICAATFLLLLSSCNVNQNIKNGEGNKNLVNVTNTPTLSQELTPTITVTPTMTPTPTFTPTPTNTPTPEPTSTPTPSPTVTPTNTPIPTITPTPTIKPTSTPKPTPTKKAENKINYNLDVYNIKYDNTNISTSDTIKFVNSFDYFTDSITGISKPQMSLDELKKEISKYGKMIGNGGMKITDYKATMNAKWQDCTDYNKNYGKIELDLKKSYKYADLAEMMRMLSRIDGVYLYKIGKSTAGNDMLALEIDLTDTEDKETVILTGNTHARETAGTVFILKELIDLLNNRDADAVKEYLSKIRIVAVPCVNPDGREGVCFDTANFTYSDGQLWKTTCNGTDLNRNFPGLSWGQVLKGYNQAYLWSSSSKTLYYPGDSAGSCNETRALMKLLYHYIVVEQSATLIDYHQQGRVGYAGKPWQTKKQEQQCIDLAKDLFNYINKGNSNKYVYTPEDYRYGLQGEGSTLTDYACSLAAGAKFSEHYGYFVMTDGKDEYPLISFKDLDNTDFSEANSRFRTTTYEIGYGRCYLGYKESTRKLLNDEYYKYHFDTMLYKLFDNILEYQNQNKEEKVLKRN